MAQRHDITKIYFQADARVANAAVESMRQKCDECDQAVLKLKNDLKMKIDANAPADQIENLRKQLRGAEKDAKQSRNAYNEIIKGMRALDQGIKAFNDGTLGQMNAAFQKTLYNAAKLAKIRLNPLSDTYKQDKAELTALMDASQQFYARLQADSAQVIKTIKQGGKVSRQAISEELTAHRELLQVLAEDDAGYQRTVRNIAILEQHQRAMGGNYAEIRKNITDTQKVTDEMLRNMYRELEQTNQEGKVTKDILRDNARAMREIRAEQGRRVQNVLGGDLSKQSEGSIRSAIANAKELIQIYGSTSKKAQELAAQIVNAEEHLKTTGVEGERAARKQAEAVKLLADKHKMMQDRVKNLSSLSAGALTETQKYWQAQMDGAAKTSRAYKEAEKNLKLIAAEQERLNKAQLQASANKLGRKNLATLSEQELTASIAAAKQLAASMKPTDAAYKQLVDDIVRAEEHVKQFGLEGQRSARQTADQMKVMEDRMKNVKTLSTSALEETRKFWQAQMDGAKRGSTAYKEAEANLKALTAEQQRLTTEQNKTMGKQLLSRGNLSTMSEGSIRQAIEAAKQYQQTLSTTDPMYKRLTKAIVDAEDHIRKYGLEAERAARKEVEAAKKAADERKKTDRLMSDQLRNGRALSESALKAQQQYWQRLIDDPKTAASSLRHYEAELKKVKQLQDQMVQTQGKNALAFFRGDTSNASASQIQEQAKALKAYRDSLPQKTHATTIAEIDEILKKVGMTAQKAAAETMSFKQAMQVSAQAGKGQFKGTVEQLTQAKKVLEDMSAKAVKGGLAWRRMQEALQRIELELKNVGHLSKEVQAVLDQPKGKSFNALKQAVDQGRAALNNMDRTTKEGQKQFDELAKKVKAADFEMKQLAGTAKGSATAFDKAWSRLKTYITLYMGAAVAIQKITATFGDLMTLSDKMGEVRKTTGFTADEVGRLSDKLAKLDTRTSLEKLMAVSAKAGQLGLKTEEDILGFTKAANMMMVALPEMGEEAATEMMKVAIATGEVKKIQEQMSKGLIDGSSATEVAMTKVASTIDQLRANSAAAAPQITDFVKRVGAVGAQSGISIDQVAALGATVDALGMRVEMSATALSRMIPAIKNNAYEIGAVIGKTEEDIKRRFATGEGMSVILDVFKAIRERSGITAQDVENDAEGAADKVEKLMEAAGFQDVIKILNQQGARAGIVFAGLSQNVDELEKNLATASVAYKENIAILNEYNKMNDTTAAKWERLKNEMEEFVVTAGNSRGLGYFIDLLRGLVNFMTGNVGPSLRAVSDLLKVFITYWAILKIGLGEAIFIKPIVGLKSMYLGLKGVIARTAEYIALKRALRNAELAHAAAATTAEKAIAAQSVATIKAKMAQEGLNKAMKANVWMAVAMAILAAVYYIVTWEKELSSAEKALADLNARIDEEKNKLDSLRDAYKQAEGNTNKRKVLMEEMNKSYGKYIGFLLTDAENTNLMALAHERAADALEREMLIREKEQGVSSIRQEKREDLTKDFASFNDDLRERLKLTSEEIGQVDLAVQDFLSRIRYDSRRGKTIFPADTEQLINQYLSSIGATATTFWDLDAEQIIATYVDRYIRENFPKANKSSLYSVTGVWHGSDGKWTNFNPMMGSTFREGYASTYLEMLKEIGKYEDSVNGLIAASDKKRSEDTEKQVEVLKKAADDAVKVITDNNSASEDIAKAYESLATAINGLKSISEDLKNNPIKITVPYKAPTITASDVDNVLNLAPWNSPKVDRNKLQEAMNRQQSQFVINTGGGVGNGGGNTNTTGPRGDYGSYDKRVDPYEQWDAAALVKRRKEMLERVQQLAGGADVQKVLSMDKRFMDEATRKGIKNMRDAIAWYNEERLKIQEELHGRNLTNTGDWMDPKKNKGSKKKPKTPESEAAIAELDRYYLERKELIEEARSREEMTEAEYNRRLDALEQEHLTKRSELRQTFTSEDKQFIQQFRQWWASVEDLDDVSWETIEAEWKAAWERDRKYNNREAQKDLTAMQAIVVKQLHEIDAIIDKERPFNGITTNLQDNLTKMGLLFKDGVEGTMEENTRRLTFLLKESEDAYNLTFDQLARDMRENGFGDWADAIINSENADKEKRAIIAQLHTVYDAVQDAIKKEASLVKKQVDIAWNDAILPNGKSMKATYEAAISALGVEQGRVSRANSLIGAGVASERVADKLAIKQMQVQLAMQEHYYNLIRKTGQQRVDDLKQAAAEQRRLNNLAEAEKLELDAKHAQMSLNLSLTKEQTELDKQREEIIAKTEESQAKLYKELMEWGDLLSGSMKTLFEAYNSANPEYYNELAKLNLTGKGGPGAGTYIVIENEGTEDAEAHYEYLDERGALERQLEIERQNAMADAWKKVMDDLNQKMSDMITDQLNAMLQNASVDANTTAVLDNTSAEKNLTEAITGLTGAITGNRGTGFTGDSETGEKLFGDAANNIRERRKGTVEVELPTGVMEQNGAFPGEEPVEDMSQRMEAYRDAAQAYGQSVVDTYTKVANDTKKVNNNMQQSTQAAFAKMTLAANMYGIAYQAMSNDNLSTAQKFELFAVQAAGNAAISMLTTNLASTEGQVAVELPGILGKAASQLGPIAGPIAFAAMSALLGGLMGLAVSKIAKAKTTIAQATGVSSVGAGRLSTGMLTYAEGNVNELTDPDTLTPGRHYNVDAADGRTYRAKYTGRHARTHITNGPEFHLAGEKGREAIIDAHTTRLLQLDDTGIWQSIQTLYNGGLPAHRRSLRRGRGVRAFAEGNLDDFEEVSADMGAGEEAAVMGSEQLAAFQSSLDRNNELLDRALTQGIHAKFDVYGKGGLVDSYDTGKKNVQRHGEKY